MKLESSLLKEFTEVPDNERAVDEVLSTWDRQASDELVDSNYCVLEDDDDDIDDAECNVKSGKYDIDSSLPLNHQLARWCVFFSVSSTTFTVLLKILAIYSVTKDLPTDSRTVLQTARSVSTRRVSGGEYFHFGIEKCFSRLLCSLSDELFQRVGNVLEIILNTDGLPCYKSVNTHIWPILGSWFSFGKVTKPFVIGVFYGIERYRRLDDFLSDFVRDYNECRTAGFTVKDRHFTVKIKAVVCDAPARAFLKNVWNHSSSYPCERCHVKGDRCFNDEEAPKRTNKTVLIMNKSHNKGPTPLSKCGIKLVSEFVLDYMHLVLLGVVKRLLFLWLYNKFDKPKVRIKPSTVRSISARLLSYIEYCPKEFSRKPRSLSEWRMFKATELRTFLLYTGMVALKDKVHINVYKNFLLLVCAMRIFLSSHYCSINAYIEQARTMLLLFVKHYRGLYGPEHVVYNVHNLIHVHKDAKKFGNLDNVSAFPFENHLQCFKKMVRSGNNTMQQLIRRIDEEERYGMLTYNVALCQDQKLRFLHDHEFRLPAPLREYANDIVGQHKVVEIGNNRFSVFTADSCIRLPDSSVGKIVNIVSLRDKRCLVAYRQYEKRKPFFSYPLNSEAVGISCVKSLSAYCLVVDIKKCKKVWVMPTNDDQWFVAADLLN